MRHLILTLEFPPIQDGGIARSMDETARALAAAGESVRVIARGRDAEIRAHDSAYPLPVTRLWGHHWIKWHPFFLRLHLPRIGRQERGAVMHTSTWETAPSVLRHARKHGWRVAVHAQGREVARTLGDRKEEGRIRSVFRQADAVFPISRHVQDLVLSLDADPARVHLIHPSVDEKRMRGGDGARFREGRKLGDGPLLLTLARLIERKGQDTVIRALPKVLRAFPDLTYVLVGTGKFQPPLESLVDEMGVRDHVRFAGFVREEDIPDAYAAAAIYVMVSREGHETGDIEGFGITYLEASAAGVPVVAGRHAGAMDAVEEGVSGVLVDPDDPAQLAEALMGLLSRPGEARRLGNAGRARVERDFTPAARARKILEVTQAWSER